MAKKGVVKGRLKKVKCPRCGQVVRLNSGGLIKSHSKNGWGSQCPGTHRKPEGD